MKSYGYLALFMALLSTAMTFIQSPAWIIGGLFSFYLAWHLLLPELKKGSYNTVTKGRVISIKANGTFLGGPHQPLHDAEIGYLDRVKKFKNLPPNFIHDVSPGDFIEITYNSRKPDESAVNFK